VSIESAVGADPPSTVRDPRSHAAGTVRSVLRPARSGHRGGRGAGTRSRRRPGTALRQEDGAITAETAVTIPSLLVLLMIFVWIILVVTAQLRVVDAARAGARAAARGESFDQSAAVAEQAAPAGAEASVSRTGDEVRVSVRVDVRPPAGIPLLPSINVAAVAYAAAEDAVGADRVITSAGAEHGAGQDSRGLASRGDDP